MAYICNGCLKIAKTWKLKSALGSHGPCENCHVTTDCHDVEAQF